MKKLFVWIAVIAVGASLVGCKKQVNTEVLIEKDAKVSSAAKALPQNKEGFISYLKDCGYKIKTSKSTGEGVIPGSLTEVDISNMPNEIIGVYEYKNNADMEQTAKTIDSNGSMIGNTIVDWINKPHFYKGENIIVTYIGDNKEIVENLEKFMGSQFAGAR